MPLLSRRRLLRAGSGCAAAIPLAAWTVGSAAARSVTTSPSPQPSPTPAPAPLPTPPQVDLPILQTAAFEGRTEVVLGNPGASICIDLHGDGSDTTEIWRNAFAEIASHDTACLRVFGEHKISAELTLPDLPQLDIVGFGAVLRKIKPETEFRLFYGYPEHSNATLSIRYLRLIGDWDAKPSPGTDNARGLAVRNYRRVVYDNLHLEAFRQMSLTAVECDEVHVLGCTVERGARDGINVSGSRLATIIGCTVRHCGDDAIAHHSTKGITDPSRKYGTVIVDNQIEDCNGIKTLGGENIIIARNTIMRPKSYGIYLGRSQVFGEGFIDHAQVTVESNTIADVVMRSYFSASTDPAYGVFIASAGAYLRQIRIANNAIRWSLPSGARVHYSDWGYGQAFTGSGWVDPVLSQGHVGKGTGIRVLSLNANDTSEIAIISNQITGARTPVTRGVA